MITSSGVPCTSCTYSAGEPGAQRLRRDPAQRHEEADQAAADEGDEREHDRPERPLQQEQRGGWH